MNTPKVNNTNTYLNVDFEDLMFVRVMNDINNCTVDMNGIFKLKLSDKSTINKRNTTHGTLNSVVSDHYAGTFHNAKFAVIAPLIELAQSNELLSISPADTYFWNTENGINVPYATLIVPDKALLEDHLVQKLNVIRYISDHTNPHNNFANMLGAIKNYFEDKNLPFYNVDNRGWVRYNFHEPTVDNGSDTQKISEYLGYQVSYGLHDGTAYSELEDTYLRAAKTLNEINSFNTVEDFEVASIHRMNELREPSYGDTVDSSLRNYYQLTANLPDHHREFYQLNILPTLNDLKSKFYSKLELWFGNDDLALDCASQLPPPLPPLLPDLQIPPSNSNQTLFLTIGDYNSHFTSKSNHKTDDLSQISSNFKNDIVRLSSSDNWLAASLTSDNLLDHFNKLHDTDKKSFGNLFQKILMDNEASSNLNAFINMSKITVKTGLLMIHGMLESVTELAPKRDLQTPELVKEWNYHKNLMLENMERDFANLATLNQTYQFLEATKEHLENAPTKTWFELLLNKHGYLQNLDVNHILDNANKIEKEYDDAVFKLKESINAPTEVMIQQKNEFLLSEQNSEQKYIQEAMLQLKSEDKSPLKRATQNLFTAAPEISIENKAEQFNDNPEKITQPIGSYLSDYINDQINPNNKHMLTEKNKLNQLKTKVDEAINNFTNVLLREGLSENDLMFTSDKPHPEVSYDARVILSKSPEARMSLSVAASALESYGQLCQSHQEHFESHFDKVIHNDVTNKNIPEGVQNNISDFFKQHETSTQHYCLLLEQFNPDIDNSTNLRKIRSLNESIDAKFSNINHSQKQTTNPVKYQFKYNI